MTNNDHHALDILAGCPTGATIYALEINCKIDSATLHNLQRRGLVRQSFDQIRNRVATMTIPRWHITDKGRDALARAT